MKPGRRAGAYTLQPTILLFACLVGSPLDLSAQAGTLAEIEDRTGEGRIDEARRGLEVWWERDRASAGREEWQTALWLRGRLTVDPVLAEIDYRRLLLEFPNGAHAGSARLRLAQSAEARGDLAEAGEHYRELERGFPRSPLREQARIWLRRYGDASNRALRAREEQRRQLETAASEDGGAVPVPLRESAGAANPPGSRSAVPFAVQLGAFVDVDRADAVADRARATGLAPRLARMRGDELVRVRLGRYGQREAADRTLQEVRRLGFQATIVRDADRELPAASRGKGPP